MELRRVVLFLILTASVAAGQTADGRSFGYVFGGPVFTNNNPFTRWQGTFATVGAGGEAAIGRFVTVGGEGGLVTSLTNEFGGSSGILTAGFSVHPKGSGGRVDPFISGGGGALVANGALGVTYVGGGLHYWFLDRVGLRFEYRLHVAIHGDGNIDFSGLRFGVTFR